MEAEYWAQINEDRVVVQVCVVTKEFMDENPEMFQGTWVQAYHDTPGKTYPSIGFKYDGRKKDFTQPEPSEYWKQAVGWVEVSAG